MILGILVLSFVEVLIGLRVHSVSFAIVLASKAMVEQIDQNVHVSMSVLV